VLKLVHRNFPLDQACNRIVPRPFHIGSCHRALLAICAGKQGKFWEANDLLFANEHKRFSAYRLALKLGLDTGKMEDCIKNPEVKKHLQNDIEKGIKHNLKGTPAFFLDGTRYRSLGQIEKLLEKAMKLSSGKTKEGFHWRGASNPKVTIYEYTDYECPFCRKFYKTLKKIVKLYPDKIRIVHVHYPLDDKCNPVLDKPFHEYACELSKLAICADKQGKFFEADDFLFKLQTKTVSRKDFAKALKLSAEKLEKCMNSRETDEELKKNIQAGMNMKIHATPTFMINGKFVPPNLLFGRVKKLMEK
jgi:protein-disulfide isomerase